MSVTKAKENGASPVEFTDIIGGHGRWQLGIFTFCLFAAAPHCMHNLIMTFFAPNIDHWCARPSEILRANVSTELWKNTSLPIVSKRGGGWELSHCTMFNKSFVNGTHYSVLSVDEDATACSSWEYDVTFYESTMVDEWDLVCDREWLVSLAKTVYMVGFLVSVTMCGQVSDRFGRRPVVITCLSVFLIAAFLTLFCTNFIMFIVLRFFVALGLTSVFTVSYVILTEVISAEYRSFYCFTFKLGWVFAYMLLPGIAWLIPSWFWLQFAITVPWLSLLCVYWVIPETPRWLLTHGKFSEVEEILIKAARKNGKDMKQIKFAITRFINQQSKLKPEEKRNETVLDLLKTPALRRNTINIYFCWFIISYIYYALSWNTNDLGGNPYLNFFISGAVELPSTIIFMYISKAIGHRIALLMSNIMAGLCLLLMIAVPTEVVWLTVTFSMAGKFFNSASFDIIYIYSAEIFPTVVRNVGVGSSSTWARVGALLAPFIRQMADVTHPVVPLAVPGGLSVLSGLLLLLLPETKGRKIPDTLEEGEQFAKRWKSYKVSDTCNGTKNDFKLNER
ncbi:organic cation transporter protein-like [Uloborus diversus]|uniref:organic cation transporter protein-like n=1 Tax=Uloborus diversus TaxID=327109 RepID=UPI00240A26AB|nr:organic cation transporter protein-like [Uloborus diversus]